MDRFMDRFGYFMDLNGTISATTSFLGADRRLVQAFKLIVEVFHLTGTGTSSDASRYPGTRKLPVHRQGQMRYGWFFLLSQDNISSVQVDKNLILKCIRTHQKQNITLNFGCIKDYGTKNHCSHCYLMAIQWGVTHHDSMKKAKFVSANVCIYIYIIIYTYKYIHSFD